VKKPFTIMRAEVEAADKSSLKADILTATGSEVEAASVLRSLERLGADPSILFYEVTQVTGRRMNGGAGTHAWRVRADRGAPPEDG
jgi:hypothetical protein